MTVVDNVTDVLAQNVGPTAARVQYEYTAVIRGVAVMGVSDDTLHRLPQIESVRSVTPVSTAYAACFYCG